MTRWQQFRAGVPVLGLLFFIHPQAVLAQGAYAPGLAQVRDLGGEFVSAPRYRTRYPGSGGGRDWYAMTLQYQTAPRWLDSVSITYYVLFRPDLREAGILDPASPYILLRGRREYVNVGEGRHVSEVYLHPSTLERYGSVERMAVVLEVGGQFAGAISEPASRDAWWEQLPPIDGLVVDRSQTPFADQSPDFYEAVRQGTGGAR